jgi:hypothetical protein
MQKATDRGTLATGLVRPGCGGDVACEAERYLALVDVFRAEGYEPRWRSQAAALPQARPSMERTKE